jgi:hypothetical protein
MERSKSIRDISRSSEPGWHALHHLPARFACGRPARERTGCVREWNETLLIVDDEDAMANAVREALKPRLQGIRHAISQCAEHFQISEIALVISISLPKMTARSHQG